MLVCLSRYWTSAFVRMICLRLNIFSIKLLLCTSVLDDHIHAAVGLWYNFPPLPVDYSVADADALICNLYSCMYYRFLCSQIYSVSAQAPVPPYGMADWGVMGITNFFRNHRCNALCNALGLDPIRGSGENHGTQPRLQTQQNK